jgi:adenosylmethionine-8-amino-7-oxononanoate aminotransferase
MSKYDELIEKDLKYIWHPFTQMKEIEMDKPIIIDHGKGIYVWDIEGNKYIDGVSSWWVNIFGHSNDRLNQALINQVGKIEHILLAGFTHQPAIELAEQIIKISAEGLTKVFYSDNGSTAVEVALKMAYQYWLQTGYPEKSKFIALKNSYHGDTLGAISVGGVDLFHKVYKPLLFDILQAHSPYCYRCPLNKDKETCNIDCLNSVEDILKKNAEQVAGIIIEPIVQGAGGMIIYPAEYLKRLRKLCDDYNVLFIDDEVAMGFGRTGKMFAYEHANITPDIVCIAKGLTGGYMPLSATLTTEKIYMAFYDDYEKLKTFYHGHSYTGNPLSTAIAVECLKMFEEYNVIESLQPKIKKLSDELEKFKTLDCVGDVRQAGMIGVVELVEDRTTKEPMKREKVAQIYKEALKRGTILRPMGNTFYFMTPYVITEEEIAELTNILYESIVATV